MTRERIAAIAWDLFEFLPLMVFVYLGRFGSDYADRFIWGAAAVLLIMPCLALARQPMNPLVIAANVWLLVEAIAFLFSIPALTDVLLSLRETAFFLTILLVGTPFASLSRRGLFRRAPADSTRVRPLSLLLLCLAALGAVWSFLHRGDELIAATLPAVTLFVAQMLLASRLNANS